MFLCRPDRRARGLWNNLSNKVMLIKSSNKGHGRLLRVWVTKICPRKLGELQNGLFFQPSFQVSPLNDHWKRFRSPLNNNNLNCVYSLRSKHKALEFLSPLSWDRFLLACLAEESSFSPHISCCLAWSKEQETIDVLMALPYCCIDSQAILGPLNN